MSDVEDQYEDKYEHYNYDQDKAMMSGHSGKQRSELPAYFAGPGVIIYFLSGLFTQTGIGQ